jgi:hypothetical protein
MIDLKDLKLKHATGTYKNLPNVGSDDIVYYSHSKKKTFTIDDLTKFFGVEKMESIEKSLGELINSDIITVVDEHKYKLNEHK